MDILIATLASALAGFIDSIVGGGGLILLPALFAVYPQVEPATLLGSNKSASVWGTAFASWRYARQVSLNWRVLAPSAALTMSGSLVGAWAVTQTSPEFLRRLLPAVLLLVLIYTLLRKDLGREHTPRWSGQSELVLTSLIGVGIGFYDGFFGPGTGSFFVFLLVRVMGYDFLHASAAAKLLNFSSNAAALILFAWTGHVWWHLALPMAVANVMGSWLGTRMALRHGAGFVRVMFIVVVSALIVKTGYDGFLR
ncbi:MAG: hypothetical protein RLZZ24_1089 [Pseudomonadota bacterium]